MKNIFVFALGVCLSVFFIQSVVAWPSPEELSNVAGMVEQSPINVDAEMPQVQPRVTCDVIGSAWGDRLCAAHCIAKGYRGGWCDSRKVCNCRR